MSMGMTIGVEDLEVHCIIGARDRERTQAQRLLISFEIEYDDAGPDTDDLAEAIDYSAAADRVRGMAGRGGFILLESLARAAAETLAADGRAARVTVTCRKPGARPDAACAFARAEWRRP